ncbi:serine hydrolase domain-containing protein [Streptomyces sp. NPDC021093]|uniref:serine hydrolase domain-containing protein n=1 Tax=Streptomyces sp. NPDC021093 TaxID=3365112 RepID=UPI003797FB36
MKGTAVRGQGSPAGGTGTAPHGRGATAPAAHPLFSAPWLREAERIAAAHRPDEDTALRVGLNLTDPTADAPRQVLVLADLTDGALSFRTGTWEQRPTLVLTLSHEDALTLLFGDPEQRVRLFEDGGLRLEGVFLFIFFLDRLLQQDPSGAVARLRALTADAPPSTDAWGEGERGGAVAAGAPVPAAPLNVPEAEAEAAAETEAARAAADTLPRTMAALRAELDRSSPGAQLYVSHAPTGTAVSAALGTCRPGVPFTRRSLPIWYCCAKTLGAVAVGQLWERGLLDPDDRVVTHLPWYAGEGREHVTLRQLLTHTSAVPMGLDPLHGIMAAPVAQRRAQLHTMTVPASPLPGARINYAPWWAWFLISEVVRAVDGRDYERYLTEEILAPCGMTDTRIVLTPEEYRAHADRLPLIHVTGGGLPVQPTHWYATEAACTRPIPGLNVRGPVSDLALFFEALNAGGQGRHGRILRPQTVMALTAHHRVGLVDPFGNADWGLGFRIESRHLGEECTAFSRYASPRTFGHYGLWTSAVFADPDAGLVVALHLNGKTWQEEHQERMITIGDAVYRDLGLAPASTATGTENPA